MTARAQMDATTTEADFQGQVVDLAKLHGWQVFHALPVQRASDGKHRTAFQGDAGFPDLVMARDARGVWRSAAKRPVGLQGATQEARNG